MSKILFLCVGAFALGVDAYIMAGLLPSIGATYTVSSAIAGQTVSVFTVFYAVSAPIFGALTAGKPVRRVLAVALGVFTLANAASALAGSFPFLLVSRAVAGMGAGLFTPLAVSAAAALVPVERRGRALGLVMGGLAMGTAVGVPVGLSLVAYGSWRAALWLVTGLGALAFAGIVLRLPSVPVAPPPSLRERLTILGDARVAATVAVSFLTAVGSIGLYTYVAPLFLAVAQIKNILPFLWAWSLGGLVGTYAAGLGIDKTKSPERVMVAMLLAMTLSFAALSLQAPQYWFVLGCFFVWGISGWGAQAPQQHRLLSLQPKHGSAAVALHSSAHYFGSAVGAASAGLALSMGIPLATLPLIALAIVLLAFIIQLFIAVRQREADRSARVQNNEEAIK